MTVVVITYVTTVAAMGLHVANSAAAGVSSRPADFALLAGWMVFPAVGALILWHRAANPVGRLLVAMGVAAAAALLASDWAVFALRTHPGVLPGGEAAAWLASWLLVPAISLAGFLPALFPTGRIAARWLRRLAWGTVTAVIVLTAAQAVAPDVVDGVDRRIRPIPNPLGVASLTGIVSIATIAAETVVLVFVLASLVNLVARYRRAVGDLRLQLRWVVFALAVLPVGFVAVVSLAVAGATSAVDIAIPVSQTVLLVAVAAAIGVGVLRYRLYDLDIVVRRSLVVAGLGVAVAAVYGATLVGFGLLVSDRGPVVSAAAVGAAALAVLPLRDRVRQAVDRLVYGHLAEPLAVLGALGDRLEGSIAGDVPGAVSEAIRAELGVPFVSVELDGGRAVTSGQRPTSTLERFPITHLGRPIGELVVAPRSSDEPLRPAERRLLSELARQSAGVFEAARLAGELHRSREQLVHSREEERRRLRRDLHDGLGPTLAGLTLRADVAAGAVDRDSAFAKTQLAELKEQLQDAVAEVRRVVSDLRPPALDQIGLAEALRQQVARIVGGDQIEMTVDVPGTLAPLPAAIEMAAYRIVGEALTNVVRHSHATRCTVTVSTTEDLEVQVHDNGSGLSTHDGTGLGLESMRARATEVGGSLDVSTAPGDGTTVTAHLPVPV